MFEPFLTQPHGFQGLPLITRFRMQTTGRDPLNPDTRVTPNLSHARDAGAAYTHLVTIAAHVCDLCMTYDALDDHIVMLEMP